MQNIDYYNNNSDAFYARTINADMSASYSEFLRHIPDQAHILDAGCGVGRDSKYFLQQGYSVTAFDGSDGMVKLASQLLSAPVRKMLFQDMDYDQEFDAVWANASLLHVPYDETPAIYSKIHAALKPKGIFCGCYKYGDGHMPTPERQFYNMNETNILPYFAGLFEVIKVWKSADDGRSSVAPSPDKAWLNFIVRKN
jgi:SAM-dependent methyltransferase